MKSSFSPGPPVKEPSLAPTPAIGDSVAEILEVLGLEKVGIFFCPLSPIDKMMTAAPNNSNPPDLVPANTGVPPFTTHYYGILGPR